MLYRVLGNTGIKISEISFGAGPISTLMVGQDRDRQLEVIRYAVQAGMNWFDTAATYGDGQSERSLGGAIQELRVADQVHVATKVRLLPADLDNIPKAVCESVHASLKRLGLSCVTLLQLHNSITQQRGDEPTSVTPHDVLSRDGIAATFHELRAQGLTQFLGLTGIGQPAALSEVVRSGLFQTMQVPYHLLNPSAGGCMPKDWPETNYGNIIDECNRVEMGVLAIRVLAGGALADNEPSPHTLKTPFFPLSLYERDRIRAKQLHSRLGPHRSMPVEAIRFVLNHPQIHSALIGFAGPWQIDQALKALERHPAAVDWSQLDM